MTEPVRTEQDIFHDLWRAGGESEDGVTVPCESEANAKRLRFALYNSLKPIKKGKMTADMKLQYAIDNCSLSFTEDGTGLMIRPKVSTMVNKAILAALGNRVIKSTEELVIEESMKRVQERLAQPEPPQENSILSVAEGNAHRYGARN